MTLAQRTGTSNALGLAGFLLILVGGVLALVEGRRGLRLDWTATDAVVIAAMGAMAVAGAALTWRERLETGGILAIAAAVVLLVLGPATPGLLCLVGGILAIVSRRIVASVA